jgi:hypothetical protein
MARRNDRPIGMVTRRRFIKSGLIFVPAVSHGQLATLPCRRKAFQSAGIPTGNLMAQWEADSLSLNDGDAVTTWTDQSGNGRNATQATGGSKPLYKVNIFGSKPALLFDGANDVLDFSVTADISAAFTAFVVLQPSTGAGAYNFGPLTWEDPAGGQANGFYLNADGSGTSSAYVPHMTVRHGNSETQNKKIGTTALSGSKYLFTWTYDGTTPVGRKNGAAQTLTTSDGGYGGHGGGSIGFAYQYYPGYIAAVIVYNSVLSAADISTVESYLNAKYPCF